MKRIVEFFYTGRVQVTPTLYKSAAALGANTLAGVLEAAPETAELLEDTEHGVHLVDACRRFYMESRFCDVSIRCQVSAFALVASIQRFLIQFGVACGWVRLGVRMRKRSCFGKNVNVFFMTKLECFCTNTIKFSF